MNKFVLILATMIGGCLSGNSNSFPKDVENAQQARELTEKGTDKRVGLILWEITDRAKQGNNCMRQYVGLEADAQFYIEQLSKKGFKVEVSSRDSRITITVCW